MNPSSSRSAAGQPPALVLALAGMLTLSVGMGIGRFAFTPMLPMMQHDYAISLTLAGWLASANYLGYLAGALLAIRMRTSPARIVRVSLVATALLTAAMGLTDAPFAWLALRALAGVFSAWILVFAAAWILPVLAQRGGEGLGGVHFAGVGFGTALTGLTCLVLLHLSVTSALAWLVLGALATLLALIAWPAYAARIGAGVGAAGRVDVPAAVSARVGAGVLAICYGCFGFGYIIPATFIPSMARDLVADPWVFGWAWPVFGAAALTSTLLAGALHRHVSNRTIWGVGHLVLAASVALPVIWPGIAGLMLSAAGVGGTFVVITLAAIQEARRLAPHGTARLMAQMTTAFAAGQALGPMLVSAVVADAASMDLVLLLAAGLLLASAWPLLGYRGS